MYSDILLPIDLLHESSWKHSLPVALEFAKIGNARIHVMTVIPDSGMAIVTQYFSKASTEEIIEQTSTALHAFVDANIPEDKFRVQHIVTTGNVYESIIAAAERINADLIIMGAHRPELKDYLLGPNSARVVRHSDRSVLVVRPPKN